MAGTKDEIPCLKCFRVGPPVGPPSMSHLQYSEINRYAENPATRGEECSLELEIVAAIQEISCAVKAISVSDRLRNAPDLIFVNVVTIEDETYCLELTFKGWRICSFYEDCMEGDYRCFQLFVKYYDNVYMLMDFISKEFTKKINEKKAQSLESSDNGKEDASEPNKPSSSAALPASNQSFEQSGCCSNDSR